MSVDESLDTSLINESLQKVAKGAGLVFIGTLLSLFLSFIGQQLLYWWMGVYICFLGCLLLLILQHGLQSFLFIHLLQQNKA